MLAFEDNTIIPSSIKGKSNTSATRKSKRKVAETLSKTTEDLRGKQEQVFFGSHLGRGRTGKLAESLADLKAKLRSGEISADAVKRLVVSSRKGFTTKKTESHAEQSLLLSETWDALKERLIKRIKASLGSTDLKSVESHDDAVLVTVILNRSSCRGCGLALSLALIDFWQQLAIGLGEKPDWQAARKKYSARVRFVARFPTIYEYTKENSINFANLEEVLGSMLSVGWEIAPIPPHITAGLDSYRQLQASLKKLGGLPSKEDMDFYKLGRKQRKSSTKKADDPDGSPLVQPPASANRVQQEALHAFLNHIAPNWNQPFQNVQGNGVHQGLNQGYMAHQIAPEHQAVAMPVVIGEEEERRRMEAYRLRVLRNNGKGALCFIYATLMGLTGQSEAEVTPMAFYVATQAGAQGGWINADSPVATNVVNVIQQIYGVQLYVVVVQHGQGDAMVSGHAGQLGGRTVLIRQTPGHYDAYVP